jgi:orotate phosphoribosyltransferase
VNYKQNFIRFISECEVLTFGKFTLKSGRLSPYFLNFGNFRTGCHISELGGFYADCIVESGIEPELIFGPAYKGIPIAIAVSVALHKKYGLNTGYCFNRKEEKDHGEGGLFVGQKPENGVKTVLVDDVVTSGKAVGEILPLLRGKSDITALVVSVDRQERGSGGTASATAQIEEKCGFKVFSIVTLDDIICALEDGVIAGREFLPAIKEYKKEHG